MLLRLFPIYRNFLDFKIFKLQITDDTINP